MKIISISMQKGGVGKSTTAVSLAGALVEKGQRVLLVDLDPQGNATTWLGAQPDGKGVFSVLCEGAKAASEVVGTESGIDLLPATTWLTGAERHLQGEVGAEMMLRKRLKPLRDKYDVVLLDTAPSLGLVTVGALVAADYVLIPVEASVLALNGLGQLLETVTAVQDRLNDDLQILGIVACQVDARTRHASEVVGLLREKFPEDTFTAVIRQNVALREAPGFGQVITEYDTKSAGAADYRALADEALQRLELEHA